MRGARIGDDDVDRLFRAANYLGAAQLYLRGNALLRRPLRGEDIKPRLLGHWGTQPGLNFIYAHLNRLICDTSVRALLVTGPGHGAPAILANLFLESTLAEYDPALSLDASGIERLVRRFSWPGGYASHLTAHVPGAIHEGGELGYCLLHAFGAALDNPHLLVACVVGDGEAETAALAGSWQSAKFLDPATSGAVLPIVHVNGYKLSGPTIFGRLGDDDARAYFAGNGYDLTVVAGDDPAAMHAAMRRALDAAYAAITTIQRRARDDGARELPRWPAILLRTPKGWTGPQALEGQPIEGTFHSHQIPIGDPAENAEHRLALERWLRSYGIGELFDADGRPRAETTRAIPAPPLTLGRSPHANGGTLTIPLDRPPVDDYAVTIERRGATASEPTSNLGPYLRDVFRRTERSANFRIMSPDETTSNRVKAIFEATGRAWLMPTIATDEYLSRAGRVMEILSEHACEGWLEAYTLTGRHGLFICYEAFVQIADSMASLHAKWLKMAGEVSWRAPVPSLNYLLTSHVWRQDQDGYSHQGPGFINTLLTKKRSIVRILLAPDANTLLVAVDEALASRNRINVVIAGKHEAPQWLSLTEARAHVARGASEWAWASTAGDDPEIVLAAAGDVPTIEVLAAVMLLREAVGDLRVRVVNVVDLLVLDPTAPRALDAGAFAALFAPDVPVVFAFHGYPSAVHGVLHGRPNADRFHVRGYDEEGTTTTPFDMLVRNGLSRFDLAAEAVRRVERLRPHAGAIADRFNERLAAHASYIREHDEDLPEIRDWEWRDA